MFERFSERARRVIIYSREEATKLKHNFLGTEHILMGILKERSGLAVSILRKLGTPIDEIRLEIEKRTAPGEKESKKDIPFTARAKKVLELSIEEARIMGHSYVGTEHVLLGLIREREGMAACVLSDFQVELTDVRLEVVKLLRHNPMHSLEAPKTPTLDEFGKDLTKLATEDCLDPVIGRSDEIERVIQILIRRTKNNPVLIGEPGVGKTAIVEGLAQQIVSNSVPDILYGKRVISLDLGLLVAGTKYRGQFEERLKSIIKEITNAKDVILFIDEMHTLVGAGAADGSMDASNMLKPSLSRGVIQCIGATTIREYRKYIERDGALERRFQSVQVDAPSADETVEIVNGIKDKYESHHGIRITDEIISFAVRLADRYITERFLPDKAIDVIDEAGSRARMKNSVMPSGLKNMESEIENLEMEKDNAIRMQEFESAANMRDQERKLKIKLEKGIKKWKNSRNKQDMILTKEDISYVVSKWTGIPLYKVNEKENEKLMKLEMEIKKHIVGQDEGIKVLARAVRRSRTGMSNPKRPVGSFIFMGPTGVGKTEMAKAIAEILFGSEDALIRFDMSEFSEKFAVSRLIGAPPGYIGYDEGGQLTERVCRKPYSVVLLDEIEKAHPDVFNILLQILEDGRLTDGLGKTVDFKNCVFIMTSNLGSRVISKKVSLGFQAKNSEKSYERMKSMVVEELKRSFTPEFLNRVDDIIVFHALEEGHLIKIMDVLIGKLNQNLEKNDFSIQVTNNAKKWLLSNMSSHSDGGARPLKKIIQQGIEDGISDEILKGNIKSSGKVKVQVKGNKLVFTQ